MICLWLFSGMRGGLDGGGEEWDTLGFTNMVAARKKLRDMREMDVF